jgi:hypothetical protein
MTIKVITTGTQTGCEHWKKCHTYIVSGTYTVATGASLKIDDGTKVLLLNGVTSGQMVFQAGSKLRAGDIVSYAVDTTTADTASTTANNGGWYFTGTVNYNNLSKKLSDFEIDEFKGSYLGSLSVSAMTVNDMRTEEFCVDKLRFEYSTVALQLETGNVKVNRIKIENCTTAFRFNEPSTLRVVKVFNVRATNFLTGFFGLFTHSILVDEGAQFIVVTTTAGTAIFLVSEDTNIDGKTYTSEQAVSNGICELKGALFIYPTPLIG